MNLIEKLITNGYQKRDLQSLSTDELVLLKQECFVENVWTAAARAARHKKGKQVTKTIKESTRDLLKVARHLKGMTKIHASTSPSGKFQGLSKIKFKRLRKERAKNFRNQTKKQRKKFYTDQAKSLKKEGYL